MDQNLAGKAALRSRFCAGLAQEQGKRPLPMIRSSVRGEQTIQIRAVAVTIAPGNGIAMAVVFPLSMLSHWSMLSTTARPGLVRLGSVP